MKVVLLSEYVPDLALAVRKQFAALSAQNAREVEQAERDRRETELREGWNRRHPLNNGPEAA